MHNPIKRPCLVCDDITCTSSWVICLASFSACMQPIQCRKESTGGTLCSQRSGKPVPSSKVQQPAIEAPSSQPTTPFCHSELHLEDQSVRQRMSCDKSQIASLLKRRGNGPKFGKRGIGLWSIWLHVNVFKCILYILYLLFLDVQHASFRCIHLQHSLSKVQNYTKKLREWSKVTEKKQEDAPVLPGCFDGIFRASWAMSHKQKWPSWLNFPIWIENWPRWLASKRQTNPQTSSLVTRPDQSLAWANLVYSHCVCVGVFGNFAKKPHQTDVPTDIKGNCEEPTTTLRESSCVSLCKSKQIQYASVRHLTFFV